MNRRPYFEDVPVFPRSRSQRARFAGAAAANPSTTAVPTGLDVGRRRPSSAQTAGPGTLDDTASPDADRVDLGRRGIVGWTWDDGALSQSP